MKFSIFFSSTIKGREKKRKKSQYRLRRVERVNKERETDCVELAIVTFYGPISIAPHKAFPSVSERSAREGNLRARGKVIERGRSPRGDQRTAVDEHQVLHAFDGQSSDL
jgi:hypothetical protein